MFNEKIVQVLLGCTTVTCSLRTGTTSEKKNSVSTPPLEKIQNIASIMVYTVRKNTAPSSVLNIEVHVVGGIEKGWPNKSRIYHN
jgi:hypothetical protein